MNKYAAVKDLTQAKSKERIFSELKIVIEFYMECCFLEQ